MGATWAPGAFPGGPQNAPGAPRGRTKILCYLPGGLRINFPARFLPGGPGDRCGLHFGSPWCSLWPSFWRPMLKRLKSRGQQSTIRESKSIENQRSRRGEKSSKNDPWGLHFGTNLGAKFAPGGLRDPLGRQVGSRSFPGRLPRRVGRPKKFNAIFRGASGEISQRDFTLPGGPGGRFGLHFGSPWGSFWLSFWRPVLKQLKCHPKVTI